MNPKRWRWFLDDKQPPPPKPEKRKDVYEPNHTFAEWAEADDSKAKAKRRSRR